MKKIRFNIPTVDGVETREGFRVWLSVGPWRRAFVLQCDGISPKGNRYCLADWASGYKVTDSLSARMLERYVRHPAGYRGDLADWRREAQRWLVEAADRKGLSLINAKLNSVPVINGVSK